MYRREKSEQRKKGKEIAAESSRQLAKKDNLQKARKIHLPDPVRVRL
jgi:hypothetical protein